MTVGQKIKEQVLEKGLKQYYISKITGISPSKLNLSLNGKRNFSYEELEIMCWALQLDIGALLIPHPPVKKGIKS
ncbi:MAG: helix-turn-helix transcriptional regulator [Candidatus Methanomethylophilaceae archaeon]|jgi:transcriptional regulator with XRE-family HTH domain